MARWDIYKIVQEDNINTKEWLGKHLHDDKKEKLEQQVDHRLMHGNDILKQDRILDTTVRKNDLFKSLWQDSHDDKTIDFDRKRGVALKKADEDKDGDLELHEYNKHKEKLADVFVESQKEQQNPIVQEFEESKKEYYADLDAVDATEKKLLFNEVSDQLADAKGSIISWNANKEMIAGNARNEIVAGNAVNVIATNGKTPEEYAATDPFAYAQEYIRQQNILRWVLA